MEKGPDFEKFFKIFQDSDPFILLQLRSAVVPFLFNVLFA